MVVRPKINHQKAILQILNAPDWSTGGVLQPSLIMIVAKVLKHTSSSNKEKRNVFQD